MPVTKRLWWLIRQTLSTKELAPFIRDERSTSFEERIFDDGVNGCGGIAMKVKLRNWEQEATKARGAAAPLAKDERRTAWKLKVKTAQWGLSRCAFKYRNRAHPIIHPEWRGPADTRVHLNALRLQYSQVLKLGRVMPLIPDPIPLYPYKSLKKKNKCFRTTPSLM